ncbi:MAG: hypothetical protein IPN97_04575 [Saprospiraceae bacterium]|nr:hypothetical protein [Saprospiraceae bacterium]
MIKELSKSDFVLNIENSEIKENLPSKLIDYCLSGRPILSIDSNNINYDNIRDFLEGNYTGQLVIENIDAYNIKECCFQNSTNIRL